MTDDQKNDGQVAALLTRNRELNAQLQQVNAGVQALNVQLNRQQQIAWDYREQARALSGVVEKLQQEKTDGEGTQ